MEWLEHFVTPSNIAAAALLLVVYWQNRSLESQSKQHNETVIKIITLIQRSATTSERMTDLLGVLVGQKDAE